MFDIQNYWSFIFAIILFQIIPGPGTLGILNTTARYGVASGFCAAAGTLLSDLLFALTAITGLAVVMQTIPFLFSSLQYLGALYLAWIGLQLFRSSKQIQDAEVVRAPSYFGSLLRAMLIGLTNPKAILFFMTFFPLFLRADASKLTLIIMVVHVSVISAIYQTSLVLIGNRVAKQFKQSKRLAKILTRLTGLALIGFGVKLILNNR